MLTAINTKILLSILAALTVISGLLYRQHEANEKAAAAAARTAAILQQQQHDSEEQKKRASEFAAQVQNNRQKHDSTAAHEGKTWKSYVP